ncbi:1-deoxy-D-xylulose 5-phosphate reductoisomerase [Thioploca ingrica]|uniref:1-deoxy-D-xylulose 5-phosphate reductoisomerase n=1 Tax=Thioploca ingrica TaxID=40754 RepID=A0A090ADQ7_9GAMM|nr:1-deoxy-D-xylulose 5-phosphate reductoisomerase [Thioploca ingrica]
MKGITILGATGSIGLNTLEVIKQHQDKFKVIALTANRDVEGLNALCLEWLPRYAVMADAQAAEQLEQRLKRAQLPVQVLSGKDGLIKVASLPEIEIVMAAIVGGAGLVPTLAAAQAGKRILLANKEALVMSGQLLLATVFKHDAELLPIDSEHNAVFQCIPPSHFNTTYDHSRTQLKTPSALADSGISRILLTASGGPFRHYSYEQMQTVTPEQACAHPNWKMGPKISVDSATMMNKGLEVIEACWLFSAQPHQVEVLLHPQSIIHSLVEYIDGSVLAQLGNPDMRTPIAHALGWPERISSDVKRLNLAEIGQLQFELVDFKKFPCLQLAYDAMLAGGTTTTILNAANEIAVQAFLQKRLRFTDIHRVIETTLSHLTGRIVTQLDLILEEDTRAREFATEIVNQYSTTNYH